MYLSIYSQRCELFFLIDSQGSPGPTFRISIDKLTLSFMLYSRKNSFEEILFSLERCIVKKNVSLQCPVGEMTGYVKAFFALS